jgi:unsaturated rhamnogalacturonyl hydrolase
MRFFISPNSAFFSIFLNQENISEIKRLKLILMQKIIGLSIFLLIVVGSKPCIGQTWVDTVDSYAREKYLPASHYMWTWVDAALLNTMVKRYDQSQAAQKQVYFDYIKKAIDKTYGIANGKTPNSVASGLGLAFLYGVTREEKYKTKADKVYADYQRIRRTKEGGVSHLMLFTELWDDTIFMIGEYLLAMYKATGDEKYIDELAKQIRLHRDKLQDKEWGLWRHGWDSDNKDHCAFCSQMHWPDKTTRRSAEMWGRGNGWIVVTLADILETLPKSHPLWNEMAGYLKEMITHLPELQDTKTGHWYQLPVRNKEPQNYIESSSTAMFAYGISAALRLGIVNDASYKTSVDLAYRGLREYSLIPVHGKYLITQNVCTGTCIGDKNYYFKRAKQKGKPYGLGMFIQFGSRYEMDHGMRASGGK